MTTHPHPLRVHRMHVNPWLVAVSTLAAALVALGSWVLVDRYATGGPTHDATTFIDSLNHALSTGNADAAVHIYAPDAVIWDEGRIIANGSKAIHAGFLEAKASNYHQQRITPVSVTGNYAVTFERASFLASPALDVFELKNGRILREWFFELGQTEPFDNAILIFP